MDTTLNIKLAPDAGTAAGGVDDGEAPPAEVTAGRMKSTAGRKPAGAADDAIDLGGLNNAGAGSNADEDTDEFGADDVAIPGGEDADEADAGGDDAGDDAPALSDTDKARYVELLGPKKVERIIRIFGDKAKDMLEGEIEDTIGDVDPDATADDAKSDQQAKPIELVSDLTLDQEAVTELRNFVGEATYDKTIKPLVEHVGKVSALAKQMQAAVTAAQKNQQAAELEVRRMQVHSLMDSLNDERIGLSIHNATPEQMAMRQQVGALAAAIQAKREQAGHKTSDRLAITLAIQKLGSSVTPQKVSQLDARQKQVGRVPSQTVRPSIPKRGEAAAVRAADAMLRKLGQSS